MRTIIDLPEEQVKSLAELCARERISRAEAVRRALTTMLNSAKLEGRENAFGAWKKRKLDGRKMVEEMREKEWKK